MAIQVHRGGWTMVTSSRRRPRPNVPVSRLHRLSHPGRLSRSDRLSRRWPLSRRWRSCRQRVDAWTPDRRLPRTLWTQASGTTLMRPQASARSAQVRRFEWHPSRRCLAHREPPNRQHPQQRFLSRRRLRPAHRRRCRPRPWNRSWRPRAWSGCRPPTLNRRPCPAKPLPRYLAHGATASREHHWRLSRCNRSRLSWMMILTPEDRPGRCRDRHRYRTPRSTGRAHQP